MQLYSGAEFLTTVAITLCLRRHTTVDASSTGPFTFEYLDSDKTILKLRCNGGCSTENPVLTIVIYNATSMTQMGAVTAPGKVPNVFNPPDMSCYFIAGGISTDEKSCHLELVITNCNLSPRLQFGCNVTHSDNRGAFTTTTTSLTVERRTAEGPFSYKYLDSDKTVLKLRCDGDCTTDIKVFSIVIYNSTSMTKMGAVSAGKAPIVFNPPIPDIYYFVGGGVSDQESCHLDLVMTNCDLLPSLQFGCNVTHSDNEGAISTTTTSLTVNRQVSPDRSQTITITTETIIIIVVTVVFIPLAVFFMFMWLRGYCRQKDRTIYQSPSNGEDSNRQVLHGDTASLSSGVSVRRMNVTGSRDRFPPLPSVPQPRSHWHKTENSQVAGNHIYDPLQYYIVPCDSEDGDVTSRKGRANRPTFSQTI